MKSIKEKSLEVFPEHCNYFTSSNNERKRIGFVAGANYVLKQVEMLLNSQRFVDNPSQELYELIEQLKK